MMLTTAGSYRYSQTSSISSNNISNTGNAKQTSMTYGDDSTDEGQQFLDLEFGLPRRLRKINSRRSGFAKMLHQLQRRHKVALWHILLGCLSMGITILLLLVEFRHHILGSDPFTARFAYLPKVHPFRRLHNLVMVAGHAVYTNTGCGKAEGENAWFLESYQKHPGQAATFVQHIKAGVESAALDENALLLFSGGETRKDAGPRSEAQSYWTVAESANWFGRKREVRWRALTEEHARDSFENLLFSICRFKELTGKYPYNITVVSYDFKEYRFANLHRLAVRFPASQFFYKGTPASPSSAAMAAKGEESVQMQFHEDPYGCAGSLRTKRMARDPFVRVIPYPDGCPELRELFSYCGTSPFSGKLPWDNPEGTYMH